MNAGKQTLLKTDPKIDPALTMTGMYNVLEKLRREEPLTDKEKQIHEQVSRITLKAPPMFGLMAPPVPAIFTLQTG